MRPSYEHAGVTIYHGDAREALYCLPRWDVVLCDPPYGVNLGVGKDMRGGSHGLAKSSYASYDDSDENFKAVVLPVLTAALLRAKRGAVFSGPRLQELPKASVIGGVHCPAASGRHRWGFNCFLPIAFYGTAPELHKGGKQTVLYSTAAAERDEHPCSKPLVWMEWLVKNASCQGELILDPFMGIGTTLVAAKNALRKAVGIDIEERYCEIAAERLRQEVLPLEMPA